MEEIEPKDLKERLESDRTPPLLLDVREPWEFEVCHIPGSTLVPMNEISDKLEDLDPDQEIVVICHHGIRSQQVGMFMEQVGFTNICNLSGGVAEWAAEVDPDMATY